VEIRAGLTVPHNGDQSFGVDQGFEWHVVEGKLARARDHHSVHLMFDQGPISPHAKLAAQDYIERVRQRAARFVTELKAGQPAFFARALLILLFDCLHHDAREVSLS
jgi:hypothetical protein